MTDAKSRDLEEGFEQPAPTAATYSFACQALLPGQVVSPVVGIEGLPEASLNRSSSVECLGLAESNRTLKTTPVFLERTTSLSQETAASMDRNVSRALVRTLRCNICWTYIPVAECSVLGGCGREEHSCCTSCLCMYLKLRVEECRVGELQCPCAGDDGCEAKATESELQSWLAPEVFEKYKRFSRIQDDSTLRACPQCNKLCAPQFRGDTQALRENHGRKVIAKGDSVSDAKRVSAEMVCESCGCAFCYYHSNAHARGPRACREYERAILKKETKLAKSYDAKKCPRCGVLTKKTDGCNHMTCTCHADWCWVCGKEITSVRQHYSNPMMPLSCDMLREPKEHGIRLTLLWTLTKLFTWPASIITLVFFCIFEAMFLVLFYLMISVLLAGFLPVLVFFGRERRKLIMRALELACTVVAGIPTSILVGVPFLLFWAAWFVLVTPVWVLLVPCGADSNLLDFMVSTPVRTIYMALEYV